MVTFDRAAYHGKHGIERNKADGLLEWDTVKHRDKLAYSQRASKEVFLVAKAKGVSEDDIWGMGQLNYYMMLQVLEQYHEELKDNQKR
jgi:hypothetical protein